MTNANDHFGSGNGSEQIYSHRPFPIVYTDGVKTMIDKCAAYWFIDVIISWQVYERINSEPFQVWELRKVNGRSFKVIAGDGNGNSIASQDIPFSDFPYDKATIWLINGCLLLPNEY